MTFLMGVALPSQAQLQLFGSDPTQLVGLNYQLTQFDASDVAAGNAGAAVSWDFSTLASDTVINGEILLPATTPYADSFTLSNLCFHVGDDYFYYLVNEFEFNNSGFFSDGILFLGDGEDPQRLMDFPVNYGDVLDDPFTSRYQFLGQSYRRKGESRAEADAYGSLQLPGSSYNQVMRVKLEETFVDSSNLFGFPLEESYDTEGYSWYTPGIYFPVLYIARIIESNGFTSDTTYYGTYTTDQVVNVAEPLAGEASLKVYPNPASDHVWLQADQAVAGELLTLRWTDAMGRTVHQEQHILSGNRLQLAVDQLPTGLYWLRVQRSDLSEEVHPIMLR